MFGEMSGEPSGDRPSEATFSSARIIGTECSIVKSTPTQRLSTKPPSVSWWWKQLASGGIRARPIRRAARFFSPDELAHVGSVHSYVKSQTVVRFVVLWQAERNGF
jgi:hypothetical protein